MANGQALPIWEETKNEMFECRGCSSVLLRRTWNFSEYDDETVQYFPPRVARRKPKWLKDIPDEVQKILLEIYRSLDGDNRALPIMGARAVIDRVISDTIGDEGTFVQKLKKLEDDRHITIKGRKILQAALEAGNAAAHRGYAPSIDQVQAVMDIVENLVQSTYVLENVANEITKSTPARPSKKVNT